MGCQEQLEVEGSQSRDPKASRDYQEQMEAGGIQSQDPKARQEMQDRKTVEANQAAQGQKASRKVRCLVESRCYREQLEVEGSQSQDPRASRDCQDQLKVVESQSRNQANLVERQCLLVGASRGQMAILAG